MNSTRFSRIISWVLLVGFCWPLPALGSQTQNVYQRIQKEYITISPDALTAGMPYAPNAEQMRATVFSLFAQKDQKSRYQRPVKSPINTDEVRGDLEFFTRGKLFKQIDYTRTFMGEAVLARMLVEPTADIQELERREKILTRLLEDEELFNFCDQSLKKMHAVEQTILSFFTKANDEYQEKVLPPLYFNQSLHDKAPEWFDKADRSPTLLVLSEAWDKFMLATSLLFIWFRWDDLTGGNTQAAYARREALMSKNDMLAMWAVFYGFILRQNKKKQYRYGGTALAGAGAGWLGYKGAQGQWGHALAGFVGSGLGGMAASAWRFAAQFARSAASGGGVVSLFRKWYSIQHEVDTIQSTAFMPENAWRQGKWIFNWHDVLAGLQWRLINFSTALRQMKDISSTFKQKTELLQLFPESQALIDLFDHPEKFSADMQKLLPMLNTNTFKGQPLPLFSHFGRISAANRVLNPLPDEDESLPAIKQDWVEVFESIGTVDAYLSIVKLIKASQDEPVKYSIARFVSQDKPYISLTNFWDPLVGEQSVPNSITMGSDFRNIILTGQNSGGKSTAMKGILTNIIMAQGLGVVPAESATLTPFHHVHTSIDVPEDRSKNMSKFIAEVRRYEQIYQKLHQAPATEFSFVIIDEFFSGTNGNKAAELAYEKAQELALHDNVLFIISTHQPEHLIKLEKELPGFFKNYKVEIDRDPKTGKLVRRHKLEPGFTLYSVVDDIIAEQEVRTAASENMVSAAAA